MHSEEPNDSILYLMHSILDNDKKNQNMFKKIAKIILVCNNVQTKKIINDETNPIKIREKISQERIRLISREINKNNYTQNYSINCKWYQIISYYLHKNPNTKISNNKSYSCAYEQFAPNYMDSIG